MHGRCQRCGANTPLPRELEAVIMRCQYCGAEQPVPDLVERQRALGQQRQQQMAYQHMASIQKTTSGITKMVFLFVGLILFVVFGITALILWRTLG